MLAINIDDVINVLNTCKPYLIALGVILAAVIIITVAVMKLQKPKKKFARAQSWIAFLAALVVIVNMICWGPMSSMISLATGAGTIAEETSAAATELCEDIADEGIVLLENKNNTLPLAEGTKLNVFGWSSTNPVYGGTGSGSLSDSYPTVSLLEGLENAGFEVNQELVDFYTEYRADRPMVGMWGQDWTIPEPTMDEYEAAGVFESAKEYSDKAVVVIARSGGEGADLPTSLDPEVEDTFNAEGGMFGASGLRYSENKDDLDASKHFLELTNRESAMLERVTSEYDDVIVVVNAANAMELGFVEEYDSISSVLWCPGTGQSGFNSLGSILAGEINPSAKTSDTFVRDLTATPTFNNFGNFKYDNMSEFDTSEGGASFVNYTDGIYVGYRFWETAAEEGFIDYDDAVQYPFGYGLSYTTFEQEMGDLNVSDGNISVDVTITNTGDVAGKDVAEIYYNPPYTNGGIEKASVNLIGFAKTGILEPGQSETVTIEFTAEEMASYDDINAKAYVLEAGDYEISLRTDSHTVVDTKIYTVDETVTYGESNPRSTDEVAATNLFDEARGDVTYLSRADGFANYDEATAAPTNFTMSDEVKATFYNNSNYDPTAYNDDADEMPTTGAKNGLTLADLRGVDYDDPQWDELLDQLTIEDMDGMIALGGYQTLAAGSVGKVQTVDCDGPASINNNFSGQGSIGFPAGVMISNTWNTELAEAFGESIGTMADEMGVSGWYAPAMNMHRSAFGGRNFEYYSEDPVLSGDIACAAVIGAESKGVYAYLKHFALNDQETNRNAQLCTWFNEQSAREIYLKPFEICVKEGGAKAVMSAFNFYGTEPAGASSIMLNDVLRGEWGFRGFALTDYYGVYGYQDADRMVRNGNDCMLVAYDTETNHMTDTESATSVQAMRQACKNIMYTVVNSRAYDPENLDTGLMSWQIAAIVIDVVLAAALIALEAAAIMKYRKRVKEQA
ncbi:MAG TPA: glycoside hydrolase family 3 C-terminal domain-containing protein [Candidatus Mediterraneibacter merdavium]|nr:glycoside hydrolase family 3 C-terminal domain-containing protein [Candidatus Mediterraneibacter merdavium]